MADAFSKSNFSLKSFEVTNGSYEYKAKGQGYLLPKACAEDGVVLISSCLSDSETEVLQEIRHWWSSVAQNVYTKDSDETNYFPVTDLISGYTYTNWSVFTCFAHLCSEPLIWKAYVKELQIQTKQSYIYVTVVYQQLLFELPKDPQVRLLWCQKPGTDIPDKTYEALICPQCKNVFKIYNETLNYPIHVFPSMNYISFKSSVKSNPWSKLRCKIQPPNVATQMDHFSSCIITSYESNFGEPADNKVAKAYALKVAFSDSNLDARAVERFTQVFICFLRQYANVNAVRPWRPTLRIYSPEVKDYFFVMKILVHDYFIFLHGNRRRDILNIFFKIIKILLKNNKNFGNQNGDNGLGLPGMESNGGDLDLPELDNLVDAHELATTNFICGCSVTLKELLTFKYLQQWLCELQCEIFNDDRKTSTDDVISLVRMCLDVSESAGFHYDIDMIVLSVCVCCMLALNELFNSSY
ncbi:hypothetical protein BgiBS90_019478 [Biomphalaria glabrata]|nr:hypothetical protein BgiBS90_019478 [Biomphalaria glabrata]